MEVMIKADVIKHRILLIRSQHVILDYDLSKLYGVPTKMLNKAVPRNIERFPADFMFQLSKAEHEILRCKIGTLGWGTYSKHLPRAFTEEGIAMLSGLLRSERAVRVNIAIMRAFVRLRRLVTEDRSLAALVTEHERRLDGHDQDIAVLHLAFFGRAAR